MNHRPKHARRWHRLAAATALALALPGVALAQGAAAPDLEGRIAQLEQMVQALKAELDAQKAATAKAAPPAGTQPAQSSTIMTAANPGTRFSFGGFIKLDAMLTKTNGGEIADGSAGRLLYLPGSIPVGAADEGTDLDAGGQFSRFWFAADSDLEGKKVRGYLEFDLFGSALGNEAATNTYGVTVRHAYATWGNWLAGQTWSNFQDAAALPDAVEFIGPTEGTVFVRQAQVRYTKGPWSVSLENPETLVTPLLGGAGRISSDDNNVPDLTVRYLHKADWGHITVAGLARQLRYQTPSGIEASGSGYGISVSGKYIINPTNDIRYMLTAGSGIGRYLGLAASNDAVLDTSADLENIGVVAGFAAWRHVFNPKLRSSFFYSAASYDNDTDYTGLGITKTLQSWHAAIIYSPLPKLDVGAELIIGNRELESGQDGDLHRLQMHVKYNF